MKVRLTEQQLKNVISEAVKNILTELDWQTYVNAAKKRKKQADRLGDDFLDRKGRSKDDMLRRSKDLMRYGGDTFNKQYRVNNYAPEDEEELGRNIDNAALDYMLYTSDNNLVNRKWDPYTKKYERNGIDIIRRRREADDDYRTDTDANHAEAVDWIVPSNVDSEDRFGNKMELGDIFDDELIDARNSQFYGF